MSDRIIAALIGTGVIQAGFFEDGAPIRFYSEFIPSNPELLAALAELASERIESSVVDRLVCAPDAVPFGTAISLKTGLPLVITVKHGGTFLLTGAFDTGQSAVLVLNNRTDETTVAEVETLITRTGGINLIGTVSIVSLRRSLTSREADTVLVSINAILAQLLRMGVITPLHEEAIRNWSNAAS